jgi:hypothetical protein
VANCRFSQFGNAFNSTVRCTCRGTGIGIIHTIIRKHRFKGKIIRAVIGLSKIEFVYLKRRELFKQSCCKRVNDTASRVTHHFVCGAKEAHLSVRKH